MFITKKHLSRRTLLRGAGATIALPLLDSMVPAGTALAQTAATPKSRLGCIYIPHGATMDKWTPATAGKDFEFSEILQAARAVSRSTCASSAISRTRSGAVDRRGHGRRREPRARGGGVPERRASGQRRPGIPGRDHRSGRCPACRPRYAAALHRALDRGASDSTAMRVSPAPTATRSRGNPRPCRCRWRTTRRSFSSGCSATAARTRNAASGANRPPACSTRCASRSERSGDAYRRRTARG